MIKSPQPVDEDVVDLVGDGDGDAAIVECEPAHDTHADRPRPRRPARRGPQGMCGVLVLACGFFMVFFAYSAAQNLQTSLAGMTGYIALGTIYVVFAVSSLFAPTAIASAGERPVLVAGALCYVPFLFANAWPRLALMLPASVLTGIGAGLIWAAQGSTLVKLAGRRIGLASGIFFVVYQANGVLGNLFTGVFLGSGHDLAVFVTFGIMAIVGALLFLPLRVPTNQELAQQAGTSGGSAATGSSGTAPEAKPEAELSVGQKLRNSFRIIFSRRMLWMVVPLVFSGTTTAFCMGKFPALVGRPRLSYVMALLAAVDAVSSFLCGKLSDRIGRIPVLLFGWFALNAANALTICAAALVRTDDGGTLAAADYAALAHRIPPRGLALLWAAAVGFGFYDSTMQTQLYSIFGLVFPDDPAAGFGGLLLLSIIHRCHCFAWFHMLFTCVHTLATDSIPLRALDRVGRVVRVQRIRARHGHGHPLVVSQRALHRRHLPRPPPRRAAHATPPHSQHQQQQPAPRAPAAPPDHHPPPPPAPPQVRQAPRRAARAPAPDAVPHPHAVAVAVTALVQRHTTPPPLLAMYQVTDIEAHTHTHQPVRAHHGTFTASGARAASAASVAPSVAAAAAAAARQHAQTPRATAHSRPARRPRAQPCRTGRAYCRRQTSRTSGT